MPGNGHVRFGPEAAGKGPAQRAPRRRPTGTPASAGRMLPPELLRGIFITVIAAPASTTPDGSEPGHEDHAGQPRGRNGVRRHLA
jgi:hypothetical protein